MDGRDGTDDGSRKRGNSGVVQQQAERKRESKQQAGCNEQSVVVRAGEGTKRAVAAETRG